MSIHHNLDVHPEPERVLYINETEIADNSICETNYDDQEQPDNVRVYIPLDLNHSAIIRRMGQIGLRNGYPTERNEFQYVSDMQKIITQLEIYDQVWFVREKNDVDSPEKKHHSLHGKKLVEEMLNILEQWEENSAAECFPYDEIDELEEEYGIVREHHWK